MRYAVVSSARFLLLVDLATKVTSVIESHRPEYYGVSWFPSRPESLVLSHSGLDNASLRALADYAQSETGWISAGLIESAPFLSAPHQILCAPDRRVLCTNTGRNALTVIDLNQPTTFQEVRLSSSRWDRLSLKETSGDHLNSIFLSGEKLYVLGHGHRNGSTLGVFDYPSMQLIGHAGIANRTGLHNIWVTSEGQQISCHSNAGAVIDLACSTPLWEAGTPIYTRGLSATAEYVLVGESERSSRTLRQNSLSALWVLDRRTWKALDYILLGPYGGVNEVRILDEPDHAHHGSTYPFVEALQESALAVGLAKARLSTAEGAASTRGLWANFDMVFGSATSAGDGFRHASNDDLCLALCAPPIGDATSLAFDYDLSNESGDRHASAVIGYRGDGSDQNMTAVMVRPISGEKCSLSIWRHNGIAWAAIEDPAFAPLPMQGRFELIVEDLQATVLIDQRTILNLGVADFLGVSTGVPTMGIRWLGSAVRPVLNSNG